MSAPIPTERPRGRHAAPTPADDFLIPDVPIYEYLFGDLAEHDSDRVALIDGMRAPRPPTASSSRQIDLFAGALAARGIGVGDAVGLLCPNVPGLRDGVPRDPPRGRHRDHHQLALHRGRDREPAARRLAALARSPSAPLLPQARGRRGRSGSPPTQLIVLDGADGHPSLRDLLAEGHHAPDVSVRPGHARRRAAVLVRHDRATQGRHAHAPQPRRQRRCRARCRSASSDDDRVLAVLPFFHIYGMTVLLNLAVRLRATLVTMPKFDLAEFLRIVAEQRTQLAVHRAADRGRARQASARRPVRPVARRRSCSREQLRSTERSPAPSPSGSTAPCGQGYGMTETSPVTHSIPVDRDDIDLSSIGLLLAEHRGAAASTPRTDPTSSPLPMGPSDPGELLIRGPQVMKGYLNRPDATADMLDADGWLHTGDIATVTAEGVFTDRGPAQGAHQVQGLPGRPGRARGRAAGAPGDRRRGRDRRARRGRPGDAEGVRGAAAGRRAHDAEGMDFVAAHVAPHEKVRIVEFIDGIPKSTSGKILRKDLRAGGGR